MKRPLALVAAPEAGLRAALAQLVRRAGYGSELADTPRRARDILDSDRVDLAIIAPNQFGTDGRVLLREVDGSPSRLVLLLNHRDKRAELVKLAPHAYVARYDPLDEHALLEWLATADAKERLPSPHVAEPELLELNGIILDRSSRLLRHSAGSEIALSRAEFAALVAFVDNPARVLTRDQLRGAIFGEELEAYDRSIDMLVSRLRRKIEVDPKNPRLIVTVPGAGYRMTMRPRKVAAASTIEPAGVPAPTPPIGDAERRQLTILASGFGDTIGLSRQQDPEDLAKIIGQLAHLCGGVIERWGGRVVAFPGDGLIAHFGYPIAHEDDPERAIRAGIDLMKAIAQVEIPNSRLKARAGIATGSVVVGCFGAVEATMPAPAALGEASSIASQLRVSAEAGTIVVDGTTRRRAGRAFSYRALSPVSVEGVHQPVRMWRLVQDASHIGRFAARTTRGAARFVGRREEMALLEHRWRLACAGAGQVIVLMGEPGIGKSRLAAEYAKSFGLEEHVQLKCFASPHHTATPLFPISRQIERAAGLTSDDAPTQKVEKLRALLGTNGAVPEESLALLAHLLLIPHPENARILQIGAQQRKKMTITLLQQLAERFASDRPLFMLWEDAQWFDGVTLELLASEVERAIRHKILLVVTARPNFKPPWADCPHIRQLTLTRLDSTDAETLIDHIIGDDEVPQALREEIVERADGIPLFLEELTKEELRRPARVPGTRLAKKIPDTLHGLLFARIDALGPAGKTVAQAGSAIGRSFSYELLRLVDPALPVDSALGQLIESELVFRRGDPPHANYVFRHALVQDAAYGSLSGRQRRDLHARIAEMLEQHFPDIVRSQPELLAHHNRQAGNSLRAVDYWLTGAECALLRSAPAEAQKQLSECFQLLRTLTDDEQRQRRELTGQLLQHRISVVTSGRTSDASWRALRRARRLCEKLQDDERLPPVIYGHWYAAWSSARFREARRNADALLDWAIHHKSPAAETHAEYGLGLCNQNIGLLEDAVRHLKRARAIDQFDTLPGAPLAGYWAAGGVRVAANLQLQFCLSLLGRIVEAEAIASEVPPTDNLESQPLAQTIVRLCASRTHALLRDPVALLDTTSLLVSAGFPDFSSHAMVYRGWALSMTDHTAEGLSLAREGIKGAAAVGYRTWHSHMTILRAECEWRAGDTAGALRTLEQGETEIAKTGERFLLAELYRVQGEIRVTTDGVGVASSLLEKSLETARHQQAKILELRAATALARLWAETDRAPETHSLLTQLIERFAGGPEFPDLRAARATTQPSP